MRMFAAWVVAVSALGCRQAETDASPLVPPNGCAAAEWPGDDGTCVPAGLPPDMDCPPGEWLRDDGTCVPAGVPPDACAEGFVPMDSGCEPILPTMPCRLGLMAVPGDEACHEVAPCAVGKWGAIPVEPDTQHVDASYVGTDSDGSASKPWPTIQQAVDVASPGSIVAIAAGSYVGDVVLGKPVRLWGVCPALVEIVGTGAELAALFVRNSDPGTEVRSLAIRGDRIGLLQSDALDVTLEAVWLHHNQLRGIDVEAAYGPASLTIRATLIEQNRDVSVFALGTQINLDRSVVRATQGVGHGVQAQLDDVISVPATLVMDRSVIEDNGDDGVTVAGGDATIDASVIRATRLNARGLHGRGLSVIPDPVLGMPSTLVMRSTLIDQNHDKGLHLSSPDATVETSVIRGTEPDATGTFGYGVAVVLDPAARHPSSLTLRTSVVERSKSAGVAVEGAEATVEATVIRDTEPDGYARFGRGVHVQSNSMTGSPGSLVLSSSVVERNYEVGVSFVGSVTVDRSVIRGTRPNAEGLHGHGIHGGNVLSTDAPSTLLLERSIVEQSHEVAVILNPATATIRSSLLRDTAPNAHGIGGHGVVVLSTPAAATVTATHIHQSALAAIAAWGAYASVGGSKLSCQAFDLNGENYEGHGAVLEDLGANWCGCDDASAACKAVSAGLSPPPALEP